MGAPGSSGGTSRPDRESLSAYRAEGRVVEFDEASLATAVSYLQKNVSMLAKGRSGRSPKEDVT